MSQPFAEFGVPAGGPPPLLLGTDRRDEPYVAQAAEHPLTYREPGEIPAYSVLSRGPASRRT